LKGNILNGIPVASDIKADVANKVGELQSQGIHPCLSTVLVGDDMASATYVKNKHKAAAEVGIISLDHRLSKDLEEVELLKLIRSLNNDEKVHGILVQLPLPKHINVFKVIDSIKPAKDVDGLTAFNAGMLMNGRAILKPCTPSGVIELFNFYGIELTGMDVTVVNRSNLVGTPLIFLLLEKDATVTICHSKTKDLIAKLRNAEVIISAVGNPNKFVIDAGMVKEGSIVVDIGISRQKGKLVGDVDFNSVIEKAKWLTPVPGGVGPLTIAMLLKNTVSAASLQALD
jgi:methylenetetrahydrofolate dehydrogenase (NADP+) / methenyltetrahydrofolate cyclohydrolase